MISTIVIYTLSLVVFLYIHSGIKAKKKLSYIEYKACKKWSELDNFQKKHSLQKLFKLEAYDLRQDLLNDKFKQKLSSTILKNKKEKDADISALKKYLFNGLTPV